MRRDGDQRSRAEANAGLSEVAGDLGRGLSGLIEGVGGLFSGLARSGLEAVDRAGGRSERAEQLTDQSRSAGDREDHDRTDRSSDDRDARQRGER